MRRDRAIEIPIFWAIALFAFALVLLLFWRQPQPDQMSAHFGRSSADLDSAQARYERDIDFLIRARDSIVAVSARREDSIRSASQGRIAYLLRKEASRSDRAPEPSIADTAIPQDVGSCLESARGALLALERCRIDSSLLEIALDSSGRENQFLREASSIKEESLQVEVVQAKKEKLATAALSASAGVIAGIVVTLLLVFR